MTNTPEKPSDEKFPYHGVSEELVNSEYFQITKNNCTKPLYALLYQYAQQFCYEPSSMGSTEHLAKAAAINLVRSIANARNWIYDIFGHLEWEEDELDGFFEQFRLELCEILKAADCFDRINEEEKAAARVIANKKED